MKTVLVIGGGPAGMMAAGAAAEKGKRVILLEKNAVMGKKLRITGKGRCNVTNAQAPEDLLAHIIGNPTFLYSAFYTFGSDNVMSFFEERGVKLKVERGNRVFPQSDQAGDIAAALEAYVRKNRVKVITGCEVKGIIVENGRVAGVTTRQGDYAGDCVVVATGGLSYPGTGSTGDGYRWAEKLGHSVTALYPSLVSLQTAERWPEELQGLSLRNIAIRAMANGKTVYTDFGELLFTHYGVSGPVILSASRFLAGCVNTQIVIDLKPALDEKALDTRILRDFEKAKNKDFKNALDELLPQKLIPVVVELCGIFPEKKVNEVTREERRCLLKLLKNLTVNITGNMGYREAVVTCGGVGVDEIDPGTMESKIVSGLFFAGEVMDVDGLTGGYNLQIAFSTGYLAGSGI